MPAILQKNVRGLPSSPNFALQKNLTYMNNFVIIDNGHGAGTPGKSSPDGQLKEWQWTRRIAEMLSQALSAQGIGNKRLVSEDRDITLRERCRRTNILARRHPGAILVSLHSNAVGSGGKWKSASGWSVFVATNASAASRRLAKALAARASEAAILGNRATPPEGYCTANLAICRDTICPAVLTENMFHDNRDDVRFMTSDAGMATIIEVHLRGILDYFNSEK